MKCPKCNTDCHRDEVDVGVGTIYGPYGCPGCGWSENEEYDLSTGKDPLREDGGAIDQYGGYHPSGSSMAKAYRLAEHPDNPWPSTPIGRGGSPHRRERQMTEQEAREIDFAIARSLEGKLCSDCPPDGYPNDKTRCTDCPRRAAPVFPYDWLSIENIEGGAP